MYPVALIKLPGKAAEEALITGDVESHTILAAAAATNNLGWGRTAEQKDFAVQIWYLLLRICDFSTNK